MSAFARATAVEPLGDGAWRATCDRSWWTQQGPNGGYLAAIVLRAMAAQLSDPARRPRSLTCHYLRPPQEGDLRIDVAVERSGRSLSTLTARLSQDARDCVIAVGAFAVELEGALDYGASAPDVPGPDATPRIPPAPGIPIAAQFEMRPAFNGAREVLVGGWLRFADHGALDAPALAMFADAWWPAPWPLLDRPAMVPTVDLTVHFRAQPADEEPVLAVFRSSTAANGFFEEDGEVWSRDGVLLAHSRQLALIVPNGA